MNLGNILRSLIPQGVHNDLFRLSSARVNDELKQRYASGLSMWWSLENLRRCGFRPANVIDIRRMRRGLDPTDADDLAGSEISHDRTTTQPTGAVAWNV